MTQRIGNPFPIFLDRAGRPLTGGKVYIGEAGKDPQIFPLAVFYDAGLSQAAAQPINTIGGIMTRDGNPSPIFVDEDQYSIRVRDADGTEVFYIAAADAGFDQFQPLDPNLTQLAELNTTSFGRGVLEQESAASLREYAGVVDPLPAAGGTVTGGILRAGAGGYAYAASGAYPQVRLFFTANGAPDPRTQVGDVWFEAEA